MQMRYERAFGDPGGVLDGESAGFYARRGRATRQSADLFLRRPPTQQPLQFAVARKSAAAVALRTVRRISLRM